MTQANNGSMEKRGKEKDFLDAFYSSWEWRLCKKGYLESVGGLCERCRAKGLIVPAEEVHHKIRLTINNYKLPEVSLNWKNLEALCMECHKKEHRKVKRWTVDEDGNVTPQ